MKKAVLLLLLVVAVLHPPVSFGQEETLTPLASGTYFTVYGPRNIDIYGVLTNIDFSYFTRLDTLLGKTKNDLAGILAKTLDALYLEVSDILDIHVYAFTGTIKIFGDQASVDSTFKKYFGQSFEERSFYIYEKNTIYISSSDLTLGMLGHEIAHAIMSHYFVVPPPAKVQEVLAGYVEYQLQKTKEIPHIK